MTEFEQKLYTPKQVESILKVSDYMVRKLCLDCTLDRINLNPHGLRPTWRITKDSVDKLLNIYPHLIPKPKKS